MKYKLAVYLCAILNKKSFYLRVVVHCCHLNSGQVCVFIITRNVKKKNQEKNNQYPTSIYWDLFSDLLKLKQSHQQSADVSGLSSLNRNKKHRQTKTKK